MAKETRRKRARGMTDRQFMKVAIAGARKSISEPGKISPKVGAVVAREGRECLLYRGSWARTGKSLWTHNRPPSSKRRHSEAQSYGRDPGIRH